MAKLKEFWTKHKKIILIVGGSVVVLGVAIGVALGIKKKSNKNKL